MANSPGLKFRITAEIRDLLKGLADAITGVDRFKAKASEAGNAVDGIFRDKNGRLRAANGRFLSDAEKAALGLKNNADQAGASVARLSKQVFSLAAAYAALRAAKALVDMADQAKTLNARLKLVTSSAEEFAIAQAGISDIANKTRSGLSETVDLYTKLAQASQEVGTTQGQLLTVTDAINKAVKLSGVSADAANAAVIQLAQGIASGKLSGDELRSVLEQTPRLAQAIAAGMNTSVGQLRKLGEQGKLTSEQVIGALLSQSGKLSEEFAQLPITVGQATTQIKNSFMEVVGDVDDATGASAGFAETLSGLADSLATSDFSPLVEFITSLKIELAGIGDGFATLGKTIDESIGEEGTAADALGFLKFSLTNLPTLVVQAVKEMTVNFASFFQKMTATAAASWEQTKAIFTDDTTEEAMARYQAEMERLETLRLDSIKQIQDEANKHMAAGEAAAARFREERAARQKAAEEAKRLAKEALDKANEKPKTPAVITGVADIIAVQKEQTDQAMKELDRLFGQGKIKLADYFAEKRRLTQQSIDLEIKEAEKKLALADKQQEKDKAATDIAVLKQKAVNAQKDITAEEAVAQEKRKQQAEQLQIDLLQIEGKGVEARRRELEEKYRETLQRMALEGDTSGINLIKRLINVEVAKERLAELEKNVKKAKDALDQAEQSAANRVQTGETTQPVAQQETDAARAQALEQLRLYRAELQGLANSDVPGAKEALAELDASIGDISARGVTGMAKAMQELRAELAQLQEDFTGDSVKALTDSLSTFFTDITTGGKSAGDALKDFARSFAQSMAQIAARALATYAVLQLLDAVYPGLGRATAAGMSAGTNHTGGIAGHSAMKRTVNPALFMGAPRYHTGGVAGLRPGEVPAILQKGEEVLTKNDPRHVANGGQQGGGGTRIINVIDPAMVQDYLSTPSGEKTILNVLQRNAGSVKQVLA